MISLTDIDYQQTKLIKQGKAIMNPDFGSLAIWINKKFGVEVLNIFYDTTSGSELRPRLTIIFEYHRDELKFRDGTAGNFKNIKQKQIAEKFNELVNGDVGHFTGLLKFLNKPVARKYDNNNLLVVFTSFEPLAKEEVNSNIPEGEIIALEKELEKFHIWKIHRLFSGVTFFFNTEQEVKEYSKNDMISILSKKYLSLLKRHDEFDYFNEDNFIVKLDSKENFDKNYESNWFYYSR